MTAAYTSHPFSFIESSNHCAITTPTNFRYEHTHPQYSKVIEIINDLYKTNSDIEKVRAELQKMLKIADACQCFVSKLENLPQLLQNQNVEDGKIVGYIQARLDTLSQDQLKLPEPPPKKGLFQRLIHHQ